LSVFFAASLSAAEDQPAAPETYPTADAVVDAYRGGAQRRSRRIVDGVGEAAEPLVSSGDDVADANARAIR
jgi:hypothetical protein